MGCRWNKCLNHLLALAKAHQEALMLDAFYSGVTSAVDPDCRRALKVPTPPSPRLVPRLPGPRRQPNHGGQLGTLCRHQHLVHPLQQPT